MKKSRYLAAVAAVIWVTIGLDMTVQAKYAYTLEVENQYDSQGISRDDNDMNRVHPLEPDVFVSDEDADVIGILTEVSWSKSPEDWITGSEVTGTVLLESSIELNKSNLDIEVANGRNDVDIISLKAYTGSDYDTDLGYI
ncbi:MAG: hypothetical protein ACLRTG_03400 [Enterocloster aldenensis]